MLKTFKYRLHPSKAQEQRMFQVLEICRHWYNMCLSERKWAWELAGRRVTKGEQEKTAAHYRRTFPQAHIVFSQTMQTVCDDLDKAFQAFFRRVEFARGAGQYRLEFARGASQQPPAANSRRIQAGEKPGYPRFKSRNHFHSFAFKQFGVGARLDGRRLKLFGIGRVAMRWHRPIEGEIKTVRIVHKAGRWYACFACEVSDEFVAGGDLSPLRGRIHEPLPKTGKAIGLDMGVSAMLTTSNGEKVDNPAYYRKSQAKLRRAQRSLQRKQRGGENRRKALLRVQRAHSHTANQRNDYAHKLARQLVDQYDLIALEDLRIRNMVRNHRLSKSILDSGWGLFRQVLTDKAASAGRELVLVNPAYTSQECSNPKCRRRHDLSLKDRWIECACGLSLDRDHNAAINILNRAGRDTSVSRNVDPLPTSNDAGKVTRATEAAAL